MTDEMTDEMLRLMIDALERENDELRMQIDNLFDDLRVITDEQLLAGLKMMDVYGPISASNAVIVGQPKDIWLAMLNAKQKEIAEKFHRP